MQKDPLAVRFSEEDHRLIEAAVTVSGRTKSEIVREGTREIARRHLRQVAETDRSEGESDG